MKLRQMTQEEAEAVFNLRSNKDFGRFLNYIADHSETVLKALLQNPKLENPEYHRGEGGGITQVLEAVEDAPAVLDKYRNQT